LFFANLATNSDVRNGLCSVFGNWKIKKWRRFVHTIAPWKMTVRHSLRNLQKWGASRLFQVKND
jgi:hypothetical protein